MKFKILLLYTSVCNAFIFDKDCREDARQIKWIVKNNINNNLALKVNILQVKSKGMYEQIKQMDNKYFQSIKKEIVEKNKKDITIWEIDLFDNMDYLITTIDNKNFYYATIIYIDFHDEEIKNKIIFPDSTEYQLNTIYLEEKK